MISEVLQGQFRRYQEASRTLQGVSGVVVFRAFQECFKGSQRVSDGIQGVSGAFKGHHSFRNALGRFEGVFKASAGVSEAFQVVLGCSWVAMGLCEFQGAPEDLKDVSGDLRDVSEFPGGIWRSQGRCISREF